MFFARHFSVLILKWINIVQFPKGNMHSAACYDLRSNTKFNIKKQRFLAPCHSLTYSKVRYDNMCKTMILLVRTNTDIDEHEKLSNISPIHKLREQCFYCCSTLHRHSRTFNNEQDSKVWSQWFVKNNWRFWLIKW